MGYNFKNIEKKWQDKWDKEKTFAQKPYAADYIC